MWNKVAVDLTIFRVGLGAVLLHGFPALAQTTFSGTGDEIETQIPIQESVDDAVPDYYEIQVGDTLWGILEDFGQDPYDWPDLWSLNAQITNPHWIYPRNRIVFTRSSLLDLPAMELEGDMGREGYNFGNLGYTEVDAECGPNIRFDQLKDVLESQEISFLKP